MKAIVSPKKNNNIETASATAFSYIFLSPQNPYSPVLKNKVSKIEMSLAKACCQI
jgi:hypothetical protein